MSVGASVWLRVWVVQRSDRLERMVPNEAGNSQEEARRGTRDSALQELSRFIDAID